MCAVGRTALLSAVHWNSSVLPLGGAPVPTLSQRLDPVQTEKVLDFWPVTWCMVWYVVARASNVECRACIFVSDAYVAYVSSARTSDGADEARQEESTHHLGSW